MLPTPHDGYARQVLYGPPDRRFALLDPRTGRVRGAARVQSQYGVCGERTLSLTVGLTRLGRLGHTRARVFFPG
jgi:hypothetical protein